VLHLQKPAKSEDVLKAVETLCATARNQSVSAQIGLPSLPAQRVISELLGSELSNTFRAASTPATGKPVRSNTPICTKTEAWSQ
jgi:hypothetical protein